MLTLTASVVVRAIVPDPFAASIERRSEILFQFILQAAVGRRDAALVLGCRLGGPRREVDRQGHAGDNKHAGDDGRDELGLHGGGG